MTLYHDLLMNHYHYPRNFQKKLKRVDARTQEDNPSCGDKISVELEIQNNKVVDISFSSVGCALSIASASMHTQRVCGMTLNEVLELTKDDALSLLQIQVTPVRLRCVLASLEAIQKAVCEYIQNNTKQRIYKTDNNSQYVRKNSSDPSR